MGGSLRRGLAFLVGAATAASMLVAGAGAVSGQSTENPVRPDSQDFVITPGDLAFVLQQIQIAEAHAERTLVNPNRSPLCSNQAVFDDRVYGQMWFEPDGGPCVGSPLLPHGLRTVDGRWNNLQPGQSGYGAARELFPRLLAPQFRQADPAGPFGPPGPATSYTQTSGVVVDHEPREISNLVVDQTTNNRAAVTKLLEFIEEDLDAYVLTPVAPGGVGGNRVDLSTLDGADGSTPDGEISVEEVMTLDRHPIFLQNVATDEGLSAPFSSWMTFFGQFFDHGLDMVEKGGNGDVLVPLHPDDPLYNPAPGSMNFIPLTRATRHGANGTDHLNRTTPFIDQNQTYTSHSAHQVFLREYKLVRADGSECTVGVGDWQSCKPNPTGRLLDAPGGGLATWADVKLQAETKLGILLDDHDVHAVPYVEADPYGRFIPGPNGMPQLAGATAAEGNLAAPVVTDGADAGQAFLDDIAHAAAPTFDVVDGVTVPAPGHDVALLARHFVTGDGRGNENVALTAAHHIFHSEHNRLIDQVQGVIAWDIADGEPRRLDEGFRADGYWDYEERLFQAARFFNEMQYQHLAVEEFLRAVAPTMDVQPLNESAYHSDLNAAITAEFAHVVYRFGHSMLTESLPRIYDDGSTSSMSLLDGFLNPDAFMEGGTLTPDEAAASLIRGLAAQVGNGIDEFVTDTLRNSLLGLPLDLATINMTRARDTGIPSLQSARQQFYAATLDPTLAPYEDWMDFGFNPSPPPRPAPRC